MPEFVSAETLVNFSDSGADTVVDVFQSVGLEQMIATLASRGITASLSANSVLDGGVEPKDYLLLTTGSSVTLRLLQPVLTSNDTDVPSVDIYIDTSGIGRTRTDAIQLEVQSPDGTFQIVGASNEEGRFALEDINFTDPVSVIRLTSIELEHNRFSADGYTLIDNVRVFGTPIEGNDDPIGSVDLQVSGFSISTPDWIVGETVTAEFDIVNAGATSTSGNIDYDIQVPTLLTNDLLHFGNITGPLGPGESRKVSVEIPVPANLQGFGSQFVEISVDPGDVINESNEENNFSFGEEFLVRPTVFLDFKTPLDLIFEIRGKQLPGEPHPIEYTVKTDGMSPLVDFVVDPEFNIDQAREITEEIQKIFERSNIPIHVTGERPEDGDYHSVRFVPQLRSFDTNGDGNRNGTLFGQAVLGVDRFNQNKNDVVAVFVDSDPFVFDAIQVANVAAHELGHAFGARHINPDTDSPDEILDYHDSENESFHNGVAVVLEPPTNEEAARSSSGEPQITHNPFYHISRYLIGAVDDDVRPGTWDEEGINLSGLTITFETLSEDIPYLYLLREIPGYLIGSDTSIERLEPTLSFANLSEGDVVPFFLEEGEQFSFLGTSMGSSDLDIIFTTREGSSQFSAIPGLVGEFEIQSIVNSNLTTIGLASVAQSFSAASSTLGGFDINGTPQDDVLVGSSSDDHIFGLGGTDTLYNSGNQSSYTLTISEFSTSLEDRRDAGNGEDLLYSIEKIDFDQNVFDVPFDLSVFSGLSSVTVLELESFTELYIALFNRAPDALGLNFWGTAFANGTTLREMTTLFFDQDETRALYPETFSNAEFVERVYENVLGRIYDQDGFDFWVPVLDDDSNEIGRDTFIFEFLRGVKPNTQDEVFLQTKVDLGAYFAVHRGMSDVDNASAAMVLFDGTQNGVDQSVAAIDSFYQQALDPTTGEFLMQIVGVLDNQFDAA